VDNHLVARRDIVKGGAAAMTVAAAASSNGQVFAVDGSQSTVTGIVFEDTSGTGERRPDDPGIASVLVSNGRDVVKTDRNGRYTLPLHDEAVIFVIKPTGYAPPIDHGVMLPRFYYIHQPRGPGTSGSAFYRGIEPTAQRPDRSISP
jgi:hypothetical protein